MPKHRLFDFKRERKSHRRIGANGYTYVVIYWPWGVNLPGPIIVGINETALPRLPDPQ